MDKDFIFNLDDEQPKPVPGSLLVAKPTVMDPVFGRSVILMIEHNDEGSFGLVLNKYIGDIFPKGQIDEDSLTMPLFQGGPVGEHFFYIHTLGPDIVPGAMPLFDGLYHSGDFEVLADYLLTHRDEGVMNQVKLIMGYSGWGVGQLQQEIDRHDWAVIENPSTELTMSPDYKSMWTQAVEQFGERYRLWLNWPDDPSMN